MADQSDDSGSLSSISSTNSSVCNGQDPEGEHELFDAIHPWRFEPQGPVFDADVQNVERIDEEYSHESDDRLQNSDWQV